MTYAIRHAEISELTLLPDIERAAGDLFQEAGLDMVASADPSDAAFLNACAIHGAVLVAADETTLGGFILVGQFDSAAHIYEVSVHPDCQRQGLGGMLIDAACRWAKGQTYDRMTLSTFKEVPWNGPFYRRRGFRELATGEWTPAMHMLRHMEELAGLPITDRCLMRKDLTHV